MSIARIVNLFSILPSPSLSLKQPLHRKTLWFHGCSTVVIVQHRLLHLQEKTIMRPLNRSCSFSPNLAFLSDIWRTTWSCGLLFSNVNPFTPLFINTNSSPRDICVIDLFLYFITSMALSGANLKLVTIPVFIFFEPGTGCFYAGETSRQPGCNNGNTYVIPFSI